MKESTKIIKYAAMALAIFLIICIALLSINALVQISNLFSEPKTENKYNELDINNNYSILNIDVKDVNIYIKKSSYLKIETDNKYIKIKEKQNQIFVTEEKHNLFKRDDSDLIIYVPSDLTFDMIALEAGAGKVIIEELKAKKLDFDLGAGKVEIDNLLVLDDAEIDGGAGAIKITNSAINNLELDLGVGKLELTSKLTGYNKIDSGIGETNIDLVGNKEDYKIKVEKGLGSVKLENKNITDNTYYGDGNSVIDINGGIGSIKVNFIAEI